MSFIVQANQTDAGMADGHADEGTFAARPYHQPADRYAVRGVRAPLRSPTDGELETVIRTVLAGNHTETTALKAVRKALEGIDCAMTYVVKAKVLAALAARARH